MTLVDKEELLRLRQKQIRDYNPNLRALADIKLALDDVLSNVKLQPHDRNVLVNLLNHRFSALYKGAKYDGLIAGAAPIATELITPPPIGPSVPIAPAPLLPIAIPMAAEPVAVEPPIELLPHVVVEPSAIHAGVEAATQHEPVSQERRSVQTAAPIKMPSIEKFKITNTYRNKFERLSTELGKHPHKLNGTPT